MSESKVKRYKIIMEKLTEEEVIELFGDMPENFPASLLMRGGLMVLPDADDEKSLAIHGYRVS